MDAGADLSSVRCPGCTYDLAGVPDGTCPECGGGFDRADLAERARLKAEKKGPRLRDLLGPLSLGMSCGLCVVCRPWGENDNGLALAWGMITWGLALIWLFINLKRLETSPLGALWTMIPAIGVPPAFAGLAQVIAWAVSIGVIAWAWRWSYARAPRATVVTLCLVVATPLTLFAAGLHLMVWPEPAWTWSTIDWPDLSGHWRPLYRAEARWVAWGAAAVAATAWWVLLAYWRRAIRQSQASPVPASTQQD